MKIVCLDAQTLGKDADLSVFCNFGEFVSFDKTAKDERIQRLNGADVVLTNKVVIDKDVIDATNLKLICVTATGTNNVDLQYAKTKGIVVKNVAGYSTNSVAQQTFATLLALLNNIKFYDNYVQTGEWIKSDIFTNLDAPIFELAGKNFGVIGLGEIGQNVAKIATAFDANVFYYSTSGANNNSNFKRLELDEMLKTCDVISIHAPLNEKTRNLIGENELKKIKNGAILLNFGRGGIVDEIAVAKIIDEKNLHFGTDVLEIEPMMANHPLLNVKNKQNLIITPHLAWGSVEARATLIAKVASNIENFIKKQE